MDSINKTARIAGAIYLSTLPIALYFWSYIPGKLIVRGNAPVTADNILNHEMWFRMSILGDLFGQVLFIALGFALYHLLRRVNKMWAGVMLGLVLVSAAVGFVNALNSLGAMILFRGADFLAVVDKTQRDAFAMFFLRLHGQGFFINEIFWGLWLLPFGILVFRSGFLPRFLGVWLVLACVGWLGQSITDLLFSNYSALVGRLSQPLVLGEMATTLWLLIKGVRVRALPVTTA